MTRKHFEYAAEIVAEIAELGRLQGADITEAAFIDLFRAFNPRFDAGRFRAKVVALRAKMAGKAGK